MARTVVIGTGGHARCLSALTRCDCVPHEDYTGDGLVLIGFGDVGIRRKLYEKFGQKVDGYVWLPGTLRNAGRGVQAMPHSIVLPGCSIGNNVLLNTGCQIDHDCEIGDHCVVSPGAILCGSVKLGHSCFIGAGAIIVQGVELPDETFVPAGTLVVGSDDFRMPQRVLRNRG